MDISDDIKKDMHSEFNDTNHPWFKESRQDLMIAIVPDKMFFVVCVWLSVSMVTFQKRMLQCLQKCKVSPYSSFFG